MAAALRLIENIITYIDEYQCNNTTFNTSQSMLQSFITENVKNVNKIKSQLNSTKTRESKPMTIDITRLLKEVVLFPSKKALNPITHSFNSPPPKPIKQIITDKTNSNR